MRSVLEILERLHVLLAVRYCYDISLCEDATERTRERARLLSWVKGRGLLAAMDAEELEILNENPESLTGDLAINASWAIEGAYLCAWTLTLHRALEYDESIEDICELAAASGFLEETAAKTVLRDEEELLECQRLLRTCLWRFRDYASGHKHRDLMDIAGRMRTVELSVKGLRLINNDLSVCGESISLLPEQEYDATQSSIQERFRAINWILAEDGERYDEADVDT